MKLRTVNFLSISFAFLANLDGFISLIEMVFNLVTKNKFTTMANADIRLIIQVISIILTFCVAYYFLRQIMKLKQQLRLSLIISQVRDIVTFDERYGHIQPLLLPYETIESFLSRTPESKYIKRLQDEITEVRSYAIETFKDYSINDIDKMIREAYDFIYQKDKK